MLHAWLRGTFFFLLGLSALWLGGSLCSKTGFQGADMHVCRAWPIQTPGTGGAALGGPPPKWRGSRKRLPLRLPHS